MEKGKVAVYAKRDRKERTQPRKRDWVLGVLLTALAVISFESPYELSFSCLADARLALLVAFFDGVHS